MGINDPFFNQIVGGGLAGAWGAIPGSRQLMPGPISNLSGMLIGDMFRGGRGDLGQVFPMPGFVSPFQGFGSLGGSNTGMPMQIFGIG